MKIRRPFRIAGYLAVITFCASYLGICGMQAFDTEETVIARTGDSLLRNARVRNGWRMTSTPRGKAGVFEVDHIGGRWSLGDLSDPSHAFVTVIDEAHSWGFFFLVHETRRLDVRIHRFPDESHARKDREESVRILQLLHRERPQVVSASAVDAYSKGRTSYRRILWLGVLGDLSILLAFAAIIFSFVKLRREVRWRKPGHCTECDYDLAGLAADKCPECGGAIARSSNDSATRRSRPGL